MRGGWLSRCRRRPRQLALDLHQPAGQACELLFDRGELLLKGVEPLQKTRFGSGARLKPSHASERADCQDGRYNQGEDCESEQEEFHLMHEFYHAPQSEGIRAQ